MMNPMKLGGQDDPILLEETDPRRESEISVAPLVNLICQCDEYGKKEGEVDGPDVVLIECGTPDDLVVEVGKW